LAWLTEHPTALFAEFEKQFGAPEVVAATYVNEMTPAELLKRLRVRRIVAAILVVVTASAAIALGVWISFMSWVKEEAEKGMGGTIKISYEEGPVEYISDGTLPRDAGNETIYYEVVYEE
jgi:hypothetical protein